MSEGNRPSGRLSPSVSWTVVTDAPLQGLSLAREEGLILAWDEADQLYLFNLRGDRVATSRAPGKVVSAQASDTGSLYVIRGERGMLWFLGKGLEPIAERPTGIDAAALAVDPHGRYAVLASKVGAHAIFNRYGRPAGQFETRQPVGHLAFVADAPLLIAAANFGAIMGLELVPAGASGKLSAELLWQQSLLSNVGRLALTGDGRMILASCYTHGIHRFDLEGNVEGAYHPGGSATHAYPDFVGRTIAVATIEADLALLNSAGNIRWQTTVPRAPVALQMDALGRFVIYGLGTGEISRLDLDKSTAPSPAESPAPRAVTGPVRKPDWSIPVAHSDEQADFAALAVLDDPPRIGFMSTRNRLEIYGADGKALGQSPEITGVGRILRTSPGYIAAATDRNFLLFDARRNGVKKLDLDLVEVTHLAMRPESFGIAFVQEQYRIGRATAGGRWLWRREMPTTVEELALDPSGRLAATLADGRMAIFDDDGTSQEVRLIEPPEPCLLIGSPDRSPEGLSWIAVARRAQWARGLDARGRTLWHQPLGFEAWQLQRLGSIALVLAPDGTAVALDGAGKVRGQARGGESQSVYAVGPRGEPIRVSRRDVNLLVTDLLGRVLWRSIAPSPLGPLAAGRQGVAAMIGRSLAWFGTPTPEGTRPARRKAEESPP
ncbi:MAG: hypothetical protein U0800_01700 [Isosphaeraceae bacterium]